MEEGARNLARAPLVLAMLHGHDHLQMFGALLPWAEREALWVGAWGFYSPLFGTQEVQSTNSCLHGGDGLW